MMEKFVVSTAMAIASTTKTVPLTFLLELKNDSDIKFKLEAATSSLSTDASVQIKMLFDKLKRSEEEAISIRLYVKELFIDLNIKFITLQCCSRKTYWFFQTKGLLHFGQSELVLLLESLPTDSTFPFDIVQLFQSIFYKSTEGYLVDDLGHSVFDNCHYLNNSDIVGILYVRENGQCTHNIIEKPLLFHILFMRLVYRKELPILLHFPTRLMLRLGFDDNVYPCSIVNKRHRQPFYRSCSGNTIATLFKGIVTKYDGFIPSLSGCHIFVNQSRKCGITISMLRSRQSDLLRLLETYVVDSTGVLALSADFAPMVDAHLVALERKNGFIRCKLFSPTCAVTNNASTGQGIASVGLSFITVSVSTKNRIKGISGSIASQIEDGVCITTSTKEMELLIESLYLSCNHSLMCDRSFGLDGDNTSRQLAVRFIWRKALKTLQ